MRSSCDTSETNCRCTWDSSSSSRILLLQAGRHLVERGGQRGEVVLAADRHAARRACPADSRWRACAACRTGTTTHRVTSEAMPASSNDQGHARPPSSVRCTSCSVCSCCGQREAGSRAGRGCRAAPPTASAGLRGPAARADQRRSARTAGGRVLPRLLLGGDRPRVRVCGMLGAELPVGDDAARGPAVGVLLHRIDHVVVGRPVRCPPAGRWPAMLERGRPRRTWLALHVRPCLGDGQAVRGLGQRRLLRVAQQAAGDLLDQEEAEDGDDHARRSPGWSRPPAAAATGASGGAACADAPRCAPAANGPQPAPAAAAAAASAAAGRPRASSQPRRRAPAAG